MSCRREASKVDVVFYGLLHHLRRATDLWNPVLPIAIQLIGDLVGRHAQHLESCRTVIGGFQG